MIKLSDTQVREFLSTHLTRRGLEVEGVELQVLNGWVTLQGELRRAGGGPAALETVQQLERDIRSTTGVLHVDFELSNWDYSEAAGWSPAEASLVT